MGQWLNVALAPPFSLETGGTLKDSWVVETMQRYCRQALKLAKVSFLGEDEGFVARIPGFHGLIATGATKREALSELESALSDWIDLALNRGLGLPRVSAQPAADLVNAR